MSVEKVWESEKYYQLAEMGSREVKHWGMQQIATLARQAKHILDVGCGEGTRLAYFAKKAHGEGVDISKTAVLLAKKRYPRLSFRVAAGEGLPFKDKTFDLVYSAYVFEHLTNPGQVLTEVVRVLAPGGRLVVVAPNYGAPNRSSPRYVGSRTKKLILGAWRDFFKTNSYTLGWNKVQPIDDPNAYEMDLDTTIEPYVGSLRDFLRKWCTIEAWSSCWEEELLHAGKHQYLFRLFARLRVYPFTMWGPHLVVVARKN